MFALKLPSQIKQGSSETAYVAVQLEPQKQRDAEILAQQAEPASEPACVWVQPREDDAEAVCVQPLEDDAISLASTTSTFSCVSFLPSDHSQERVVERGISEHEIKQAKVRGRMFLAVRFGNDCVQQQARTNARKWGSRLTAALPGLSLGDAKPKGPPGDRRIEVELVMSEGMARDVKRWLVDKRYFSNRNRVLYIFQPSPGEEIVVVEGLLDDPIDDVGIITALRRVDNTPMSACHARRAHGGNLKDPHIAPEWRGVQEAVVVHKREDASRSWEERTGPGWCNKNTVPWSPSKLPTLSVNITTVSVDANRCPTIKGQLGKNTRKIVRSQKRG
jgi:hypothetical protein